jgi:hypothetical protein
MNTMRFAANPALWAGVLFAAGIAGTADTVYADAYAISYDNIFNGTVIENNPANFLFGPATSTSADGASLNGTGPSNSDVKISPALADAPIAIAPGSAVAPAENSYTAVGSTGTNYAYGDARVVSVQTGGIPPATTIQAVNIAEGNVVGNNFAESRGNNSSATFFNVTLSVLSPDFITFDFDAAPYMEVILGPEALLGSKAEAILGMSIVITNLAGVEVFNWAPNGQVNNADITGTVGGTEVLDDFTLNTTLTQLITGTQVYDPTGAGAPVGNLSPVAFGNFTAQTGVLAAGDYNLTLQASERESLIIASQVIPEPGTIILMGAGLIGLGLAARRRLM